MSDLSDPSDPSDLSEMPRKRFMLLTLLSLLLLPCALRGEEEPPALYVDGVIVVVNEEVVTLGELNQEMLRMMRMLAKPQEADESVLREAAIRNLVNRKLLAQYAEKEDVEIDEAGMEEMVAERVASYGSEAALVKAVFPLEVITREGLSIEDVKREFRTQQKIREVVRMKTGGGVFITPQMMLEYYEANRDKWALPERVRFREIEIIYLPKDSEYRPANYREFEKADAAKKFTEDLLAEIKEGGQDFVKAATNLSMSPWHEDGGLRTRADGGAWHSRDDIKEFMVKFLFDDNTKNGQMSEVIRGNEKPNGEASYYILLLEERQPAQTLSFEEAQEEINARIMAEERGKRTDALLRQIYRDAFIYPEKFRHYNE